MIKHTIQSATLLLLTVFTTMGQNSEWEIAKQADGITVYTRTVEGFDIKELKAEILIDAPIHNVVNVLLNVENYPTWAYNYSEAKLLKREGNTSIIYIIMDIPWPMEDRDNVIKMVKESNGDTTIIKSTTIKGYIAPQKGITRIPYHVGSWTLVKKGNKTETTLQTHAIPGGEAPEWLLNIFLTEGPYESLLALSMLAQEKSK